MRRGLQYLEYCAQSSVYCAVSFNSAINLRTQQNIRSTRIKKTAFGVKYIGEQFASDFAVDPVSQALSATTCYSVDSLRAFSCIDKQFHFRCSLSRWQAIPASLVGSASDLRNTRSCLLPQHREPIFDIARCSPDRAVPQYSLRDFLRRFLSEKSRGNCVRTFHEAVSKLRFARQGGCERNDAGHVPSLFEQKHDALDEFGGRKEGREAKCRARWTRFSIAPFWECRWTYTFKPVKSAGIYGWTICLFSYILFHAWIWMLCLNQSKQKQTGQWKRSRYSWSRSL